MDKFKNLSSVDLLRERADLLEAAEKILETVDGAERDITAAEDRKLDANRQEAKLISDALDRRAASGERWLRGWRKPGWSTGTIFREQLIEGPWAYRGQGGTDDVEIMRGPGGREIRALGPQARLVDQVAGRLELPGGAQADELSVGRYVKGMLTGNWQDAEAERELRALSGSEDISGGFLLPEPLSAQVIDLARARVALIRAGARTIDMGAAQLSIAKLDADPTAAWKAENAATTEDTTTSFGRITLFAKTLIAVVRSSAELVMDSPNFSQLLESTMGEVLAIKLDQAGLLGDGGDTYGGIVGVRNVAGTNSVTGVGAIGYDPFSEAVEAIAEANLTAEAAILHPRDAGSLDRKKDGSGNPLEAPESWRSLRKVTTTSLPIDEGVGSDESVAFVGGFDELYMGVRMPITFEISREADNAFRDFQILFRCVLRADFGVARPTGLTVISGITA